MRGPDIVFSAATADLELIGVPGPVGRDACLLDHPERTEFVEGTPDPTPEHRRDTSYAVRLGLDSVRGIGRDVAKRIVAARAERPFTDMVDLARRAGLERRQLEALATADALAGFQMTRREALWQAGYVEHEGHLPGSGPRPSAPALPAMTPTEETLADLWATSITPESHPFTHLRAQLSSAGVFAVTELATVEPGRRIRVAGLITHRQRPSTAGGVTFLNLEDETGMLNVVCSAGVWQRHRQVARTAATMVIRGILERQDGVTNLVADQLLTLADVSPAADRALATRHRSRDFR